MNWFSVILKKILEPTWSFVIPCLAFTSLLTFSPFSLRQLLGIEQFYRDWRLYISLLLLYSVTIFLYKTTVLLVCKSRSIIQQKRYCKQHSERVAAFLQDLPPQEAKMLSYILSSRSDVVWVPYYFPEVQSLLVKEIIYMVSNQITLPRKNVVPRYSDWEYEYCAAVSVDDEVKALYKS